METEKQVPLKVYFGCSLAGLSAIGVAGVMCSIAAIQRDPPFFAFIFGCLLLPVMGLAWVGTAMLVGLNWAQLGWKRMLLANLIPLVCLVLAMLIPEYPDAKVRWRFEKHFQDYQAAADDALKIRRAGYTWGDHLLPKKLRYLTGDGHVVLGQRHGKISVTFSSMPGFNNEELGYFPQGTDAYQDVSEGFYADEKLAPGWYRIRPYDL